MSLSKMSYNTAQKIIDIYSGLLINLDKRGEYEKYGYSDLKGYDIIDIDNALKLMTAYRVFNLRTTDQNKLTEIKKYSSEDGGTVFGFFWHFFPDKIAAEINKLDPNEKLSILDYTERLTENFEKSEWRLLLNNQETHGSFLEYCLAIKESDDFWEKVYKRLDIMWETNNEKDLIYFCIKHKNYFMKTIPESDNNNYISDKANNEKKNSFISFITRLFKTQR